MSFFDTSEPGTDFGALKNEQPVTFSRQWISSRTWIRRKCLSLNNFGRTGYSSRPASLSA